MKCSLAAVLITLVFSSRGLAAWTTEYVNDGGIHEFNGTNHITGNVDVAIDWNYSGPSTTVNVVDGGLVCRLSYYGDSQGTISGGHFTEMLVVYGSAHVLVSGGVIDNDLRLHSGGHVTMTGGEVFGMVSATTGSITVSGGLIHGYCAVSTGSTFTLVGTDFSIDGVPVGYGQYLLSGSTFYNNVAGQLANGDYIDTYFYAHDVGSDAYVTLAPVPEPTSMAIHALGSIGMLVRRRGVGR